MRVRGRETSRNDQLKYRDLTNENDQRVGERLISARQRVGEVSLDEIVRSAVAAAGMLP